MVLKAEGEPTKEVPKAYTLYIRDNCAPCQKVLSAIKELKIEEHFEYKNTTTNPEYRDEIEAKEGYVLHPYLWNHATKKGMFQSDDIVTYLKSVYGTASA
jgi:glutaredoxin